MPEDKTTSVPFESANPDEERLWAALADMPRGEPSADMRRSFYRRLEQASAEGWGERMSRWLGFRNQAGWATAMVCLLVGFASSQLLKPQDADEGGRLAQLEENVTLLQRELILDRLQDEAAGTRLAGIHEASLVAQKDSRIANALLQRAANDRSASVRSAAIDALGPQLNSGALGNELMALLESAESPIVQLALVDLVLRNGSASQLEQLSRLADENRLHPDLVIHVHKALGSEAI